MSGVYRLIDPSPPAPLAVAAARPTPLHRKLRRLHHRAGLSSSFWLTSVCGAVLLVVINGTGHARLWFAVMIFIQVVVLVAFPMWRGSRRLRERMLRHAYRAQRERNRRALPADVRELLDSPSLVDQEVALNKMGQAIDPEEHSDDGLRADYIHYMKGGRVVKIRRISRTTVLAYLPLGKQRVSK